MSHNDRYTIGRIMRDSNVISFFIIVMVATEEEMNAANLRPHERDYCAHFMIELKACQHREGNLFLYRCHHEKHAMHHCQYDE
jgi:hypothetical protein